MRPLRGCFSASRRVRARSLTRHVNESWMRDNTRAPSGRLPEMVSSACDCRAGIGDSDRAARLAAWKNAAPLASGRCGWRLSDTAGRFKSFGCRADLNAGGQSMPPPPTLRGVFQIVAQAARRASPSESPIPARVAPPCSSCLRRGGGWTSRCGSRGPLRAVTHSFELVTGNCRVSICPPESRSDSDGTRSSDRTEP